MPACEVCGRDRPEAGGVCSHGESGERTDFWAEDGAALEAIPARADECQDVAPGTMLGEYRVEERIGQGGMATVYAAVHPVIGKRAAIKVINRDLAHDPTLVSRFVQEARAVNQVAHPNLPDVFAFGQLADGRPYFVMEWLRGEDLGARLAREALPVDAALQVLEQVALALEAAHRKGVVHRDVKPENIFLCETGEPADGGPRVKLLDFGIAKLMRPPAGVGHRTKTGAGVGTPAYVSPEQARARNVGPASDVYALGVVAYELVAGRLPFDEPSAVETIHKHLFDPPPPPSSAWPEIPAALERLILAMLAKRAEDRPALSEVRAGLQAVRESLTPAQVAHVTGDPPSQVDSLRRSSSAPIRAARRRRPGTLVAAGGGALLLALAAFLAIRGHGSSPPSPRARHRYAHDPSVARAKPRAPTPGTHTRVRLTSAGIDTGRSASTRAGTSASTKTSASSGHEHPPRDTSRTPKPAPAASPTAPLPNSRPKDYDYTLNPFAH